MSPWPRGWSPIAVTDAARGCPSGMRASRASLTHACLSSLLVACSGVEHGSPRTEATSENRPDAAGDTRPEDVGGAPFTTDAGPVGAPMMEGAPTPVLQAPPPPDAGPALPVMPGESRPTTPVASLTFRRQTLHMVNHAEGIGHADFNGDGHLDVVSGHLWWEGPAFEKQREYARARPVVSLTGGTRNDWANYAADFDGDGWPDVVAVNRPGEESFWYKNPGRPVLDAAVGTWARTPIGRLAPEHYAFADISGDGKPDLVAARDGQLGYLDPAADWRFTNVAGSGYWRDPFTHGLGAGDVDGDGKLDLLEKGGWWGRDGGGEWRKRPVAFSSQGGAHMYAYDVDGDGDNDVVTSLAAHGWGLAWFEQTSPGQFTRHLLLGSDKEKDMFGGRAVSQLHALVVHDMDGDGLQDIVTGKSFYAHPPGSGDPDAAGTPYILIFRLTREGGAVKFVVHEADSTIGLGRQFAVADLDADGLPDILVGNKKGVHLFFQRPAR